MCRPCLLQSMLRTLLGSWVCTSSDESAGLGQSRHSNAHHVRWLHRASHYERHVPMPPVSLAIMTGASRVGTRGPGLCACMLLADAVHLWAQVGTASLLEKVWREGVGT